MMKKIILMLPLLGMMAACDSLTQKEQPAARWSVH
jgi:hypothetical protein